MNCLGGAEGRRWAGVAWYCGETKDVSACGFETIRASFRTPRRRLMLGGAVESSSVRLGGIACSATGFTINSSLALS